VGKYTATDKIAFTGTPEYKVILEKDNKSTYTVTVGKGESLSIPSSETALSFIDKTGAPGTFTCIPSSTYTLNASATGFCADAAGVTFSLSGTQSGRSYQLYKGATTVTTLTGTGSAATFSGNMTEGTYTAKVLASAGYCEATMAGSPAISRNSLPTQPTIAKPDDVCLNGGNLVFTATGYSGSLTWTSAGGGVVNNNTITFASTATGIKTVTARSAQTYTNAATCYSAEVTQWATVNAIPGAPTMSGAGTHCTGSANITASAGTYGNGIKWDDGSTASARTVTVSGTYMAITTSAAGCTSSTATITITVGTPSGSGSAPNTACNCASGLTDCDGTCQASCGNFTACEGFTEVTCATSDGCYTTTVSNASNYCSAKGMRLPTVAELECLCAHRTELPITAPAGVHWSGEGTPYFNVPTVDFYNCSTSGLQGRSDQKAYAVCVNK
jgi:hypothetical protein